MSIDKLETILNENKDKRICVLGTTCTGKTTLINQLNIGVDMDEEIFPLLTKEETEYVCRTPWTEEIGKKMDELVRTKLKIQKGIPMFGTVLLDSDLIVYLHIEDKLLRKRVQSRNANFENAKNMQKKIEEEIEKSNIEVITVEVCENLKPSKELLESLKEDKMILKEVKEGKREGCVTIEELKRKLNQPFDD